MKMKKWQALAVAVAGLGLAAASASAGTIVNPWSGVTGDRGNMTSFAFQATGGTYPTDVTGGPVPNPLTLNSVTLTRPDDTTTPSFGTGTNQLTDTNTPVFLNIYTGTTDTNTYTGFVGASSNSLTFAGTTQNGDYTFNFTGVSLVPTQKYWMVFSEFDTLNQTGGLTNFRVKLNTSGTDGTAGPGKGYIVGVDTDQARTAGAVPLAEDWGTAQVENFTSVPEPASLSLLALAGLGLIRRRRD